ncbi:MAG TPA: histidine kinase [Solirubrobacteraceae bacterium]|jgi:signal transduction histidine kinase|nr:histidine kinase [Solirubrobacteraceae bacterium]
MSMFLARPWRIRQLAARRRDFLVVAALAALVIASVIANAIHDDQPITVLLIPGALAAIFLRRRQPAAALLLAVILASATPGDRAVVLPVMAVLYTMAGRMPWRQAAAAAAGAAAVAIAGGVTWGSGSVTEHGGLLGYAIGITASCAAAVAAGLYVGAQRRVRDGLRDRAERLDRERELLADRAVAQERVRIAQELHDIVAHNVSLMVVEAQALGATAHDDKVTATTDAIADLGRQAMAEMHTTLRLLRADGEEPELAPQPGLAQLERLIEQLRHTGLEIELTVVGQPRVLPPGADLSAYRIIQEALTNVVKHAAGASTKVTLVYQVQALELTITDTERDGRALSAPQSDGHGVIGMRERAALFGGWLTTEPLPDGFKVTANLPYTASPS